MKLKKIIILLLLFLIIISTIIIDSIAISPHKINIREETISSTKINKSLNGTTIVFFSDLHFANFTYKDDLDEMVEKINSVDPDVVIFGGDLIDNYGYRYETTEEDREYLITKLNEITSNYGKYAVLGNHDIDPEPNTRIVIDSILIQSGFNIITNSNVTIHTEGGESFNIVGVDSSYTGSPDLNSAYENMDSSKYTIMVTHCPDFFDSINTDNTDYVLSGHSHGCQIFVPLINILYRKEGARKYIRGKHKRNNTIMDITNGVGLSRMNIRLFADAEIVFYKLQSKNS